MSAHAHAMSPPPEPGAAPDGSAPDVVPIPRVLERLSKVDVEASDAETALSVARECELLIAFVHEVQARARARFVALRPAEGNRARALGEFAADEVAPASDP